MRLKLPLWLALAALASTAAAQTAPPYPPPPSPPYPPPPTRTEELPPPPAPPQAQEPTPPPAAATTPSGPEPQHQGDVTFVSGGAGEEDRTAMREMARDYNLRLQFATSGSGQYLAGVNVTLTDDKGKAILDTIADGPLFFAKLRPGHYKITVAESGRTQTRNITVPANAAIAEAFYWPAS